MEQNQQLARQDSLPPEIMESIVTKGDLSGLTPAQMTQYYIQYCHALGLNPTTKPFTVLTFQGKKILYAGRETAAQLNKLYCVSHEVLKRYVENGCYCVEVRALLPDGRVTESIGIVNITRRDAQDKEIGLMFGEAYANAIKKAETQAKRRATLDICGLGMNDEETERMPESKEPNESNINQPSKKVTII
jgi:hypothetical protein